jgi:hypothetical protein
MQDINITKKKQKTCVTQGNQKRLIETDESQWKR